VTDNRGAGFFDRGIRIADGIVRRPRGYWSVAVQDLLRWLDGTGFGLSPTPIGLDERFEYLQYIGGADQGWPLLPFIQSLEGARTAGAFARRLESILAAYEPADDARWQSAGRVQPRSPVQHGDVGPWNLLWDNERGDICGIIDWDLAGPAPEGYDAGLLAWFIVPVMNDDRAYERGFDIPIDRGNRLRAYSEGYGIGYIDMLDRIVASQDELRNRILSASEDVSPTYAALKQLGIAERIREDILFARSWREECL
jgi:thiamine kinase-like enzyme